MKRVLPAALTLTLWGCGIWPSTPPAGGQLVVQNPLYGRFQTAVIPEGASRIVILVTTRSDEQSRPAALVTMDAREREAIIRDLPVGRADVVVAAFDGGLTPVAANGSDVTIIPSVSGQRTRLVLDLSTDDGVLRRLASALARMKPSPHATPTPAATAAPAVSPSALPTSLSSREPLLPLPSASAQPSVRPTELPAPAPGSSGNPQFILPSFSFEEAFSGSALDPTRWQQRTSGDPVPTITVSNGLTLAIAPGARPNGHPTTVHAEIVTAQSTFFDVDASTAVTVSGDVTAGTQVGLFTTGAGLYRTVSDGRPVFVLEANGGRLEIPAPAAGGMDDLRLIRQGLTYQGFAGTAGDLKPVGTVPATFGAIPMHLGIRTTDASRTGVTARFRSAKVGLLAAPPAP